MAAETCVCLRSIRKVKEIGNVPIPRLENPPVPVETSRRRRPCPTANPANPANPVHACVQEIGEEKGGVVMAWKWVSEVGVAA